MIVDDSHGMIDSDFIGEHQPNLELVCKKWQQINQTFWHSILKLKFVLVDPDEQFYSVPIRSGLEFRSSNFSDFGKILKKLHGNLQKLRIFNDLRYEQEVNIPSSIFKLIIENENINFLDIDINNKDIYKKCLKFLKTDNLQHLSLSRPFLNKSSSSILDVIKKLLLNAPKLETLHLSNLEISLKEISKITTLKSLYIMKPGKSPGSCVKNFGFINLESIHLIHGSDVKDNFIKQLVTDCKKLHNVEIYSCDSITTKGLIPITTLPELRHFGATHIDEEVFKELSNLESIDCSDLTLNSNSMKASISNFFQRSPNLKKAHICLNGDPYLFDEYTRKSRIVLNQDQKFYGFCICSINWRKQFDN
ncbi:hypothetical protein PV327_005161 [Microctonus hyperodae]|uniref:Uncharacterized protein n=1 Tax=Microctonus hyperodae TaxID=165561 RepID=A0AA39G1M4_MICHY|nr:hypothetical protein PV327_005161 [Microctonus hyperodae]